MDNSAMFGRRKVGRLHDAFIKLSEVFEVNKIRGFTKTKIVNRLSITIVHQYPFFFSNTFPDIRCFTGLGLWIVPARVESITSVCTIGNRLLYASYTIV